MVNLHGMDELERGQRILAIRNGILRLVQDGRAQKCRPGFVIKKGLLCTAGASQEP